jgi:two-component system, OmpR family, alkaline phosphatase synthesis response regulator PhoP
MSDHRRQILVVEDEADIRRLVRYNLEQEGYTLLEAADGEEALALARKQRPHLVVLDLMLPGMNGLEVCRVLRAEERTAKLPVLMLTARATEVDKVLGLEIGADDYVTKPFSPREVVARVKALLRRAYGTDAGRPREVWERGRLRIDLDGYEAFLDGKPLHLSLREFELLRFFVQNPERAFSRGDILDLVWGSDTHVEPRTVDVHVRRLRLQIERDDANPELILTVRGFGYKFKPEALDKPLRRTGTRS